MSDPATDAQIAASWPDRWARANDPSLRNRSKARNNLRKAFAYALRVDAIREANPDARCATCKHYEQMPHGERKHCSIERDFHGYLMTAPDSLCDKFSERTKHND